jgi:PAS domain S-box-containing protein
MTSSRVSSLSPGRIALGYAVIAILWIAFSNAVVVYLKLPPAVQTIKGTIFVFVTALLLYFTIRRLVQAVQLTRQERDETADLYRTVVQASHEGACLLDESGRMSFLNERLATILGRPAEELQGQRLQDFLEEPQVLALPGAQQSETRECRLRKDSDPKPWVLISRHPVLNDAGEVVRLVVTVIDISERKRADQALRRSDAYPAPVPGSQENPGESQLTRPLRYGLAIISVGVALGTGLLLQYFHFHVPSALLLFAVAISSWYGGRGPAGLAAVLAVTSYYYYFVEPVHTIYINRSEIPFFIIFVAFAVLLAWFGSVRRRIEAGLRAQADLLNLSHDTIFVMDMHGVIQYWNRGAEERYGWTAEKAVGKVVHDLLKTVFPRPLEEIKAELIQTGRWEGYLLHTKKDGTQVAVASRWSLQRDRHGAPFAILETNNDISERKRAEEALSRSNRELCAISNCNQVLLRATDEQSLLEEICRIVCEEAGYRVAWVGYAEHDEAKTVRPVAWAGIEEAVIAKLGVSWAETERGGGPGATAIRTGKTCCISDYVTDPQVAPWREIALQHGFRSAVAMPLKDEYANPFGTLIIYCDQPNAFTLEEIRLLEELAGDLAFGIVTLRTRAARDRAKGEVGLLSFALDNVREAAFLIDDRGRFKYANDEGCRSLGYTRAELLGLGVSDIDPEFPAELWADHWLDLKGRRSLSFESCHRTKDGRSFPVEISANYFEYGGQPYNLALARDITERKRAEEDVRNAAAQWQATFDAVQDLVLLLDKDFRILRANRAAAGFLGLPFDKIVGGHCYDLIHGTSMPPAECPLAKMRQSRRHEETEVLARKGGPWLSVSVDPVFDPSGELTHAVHVARDITDRKRAEDALRRSEARLAEGQQLSHTGSWAWSPVTLESLYWSDEMFRIYGLNPQEGVPTAETFWQRIHPEDRDRFRELQMKVAQQSLDYKHDHRIVLPDGTVKHIHAIGHPVHDEAGKLVEYVGTAMDVTERKRAEAELRRSEAYLAEGQRLSRTGSWAWSADRAGRHYWSEEMFRIFGFEPKEGPPALERFLQRIHPEDYDRTTKDWEKTLREKADLVADFRTLLPDGTIRNIHIIGHPFLEETGQVTEYVGTAVDVTERKRAEETLRESESRFRTLVDHATDAFFLLDRDEQSKIVDVNRQACESLGYTREELIGLTPREFDPDADEAFLQRLDEQLNAGVVCTFETRHRRKDGTVFPVEIRIRPFSQGGHLLSLALARDITERKRVQDDLRKHREHLEDMVKHRTEQLVEAKARAEAASRAKGTFLANMSHELRTPLNAVLGFSRLLKSGPDVTPDQQEALDIIVRSGEHLLKLINNVLDMAKIESGRVVVEESEVDLHRLLHEMQSLMGVGAAEKGLEFALEFAPDLPRFVAVDAGKLRQVLINLIGNAIKYTDSGGVKLRAKFANGEGSKRPQVRFEVEDSGPGISREHCERIFLPFVQLGDRISVRAGTGLGLGISKQYVELMGGQIGVASEPGKGSVFYFNIPVRILPSVAERDELKHGRVLGLAEGQPCYRLLIVEDQPENRLLLRRLLDPLGFELREAANGQEALALFEQWHPDLIWMDILMPVMDGLEAVRRIRATKAGADTKIIALTAHALDEESGPIMAAGCDDLVRKPFHEQELFDALARHLRLKFIFEKAPRQESTGQAPALALRPEQLDALPAQLLQDLRQAVIELDTARTHALIEQVTERDASLGRALDTLATQLDYQRLLKLLDTEHS